MKIKKVNYDSNSCSGCDTCDWGSSYISNIEIILENDEIIKIETEQMYEYTLTESDYMQLLVNSKDINDFYKNMFERIKNSSYDIIARELLQYMIILINNKKINIAESCKCHKPVYIEEVEE